MNETQFPSPSGGPAAPPPPALPPPDDQHNDQAVSLLALLRLAQVAQPLKRQRLEELFYKRLGDYIERRFRDLSQHERQDLAQEVKAKAFENTEKLLAKSSEGELLRWINKVGINKLIDGIRKVKGRKPEEEVGTAPDPDGPHPPRQPIRVEPELGEQGQWKDPLDEEPEPGTQRPDWMAIRLFEVCPDDLSYWRTSILSTLNNEGARHLFRRRVFALRLSLFEDPKPTLEQIGAQLRQEFGIGGAATAMRDVERASREFYAWREGISPDEIPQLPRDARGRRPDAPVTAPEPAGESQ